MKLWKLTWVALAALAAACGPLGESAAREDDEEAEERSADADRDTRSPAKNADAAAMPEAPAEAPLAGEWRLDGSVMGRVDAGVFRIFDVTQVIYEDGVADMTGRIEATDGEESASFSIEAVGSWTRDGDRVQSRISEVTVTPEQSGADYREAARLLEIAIREQPSTSYDIIELDAGTLRLRNISDGTVESYTR
ncbi:MAG: hypothetical protein H7X93_12940 [Sphingomonadaceae bacterium]|nr:hypothetical protein [Sphingomonadaceae bacterium]